MNSIKKVVWYIAFMFSFAAYGDQPVEMHSSDKLVESEIATPEKIVILGKFFFNVMTGVIFNYMRDSFRMYQNAHPIQAGLLGTYIEGKHISSDINRTVVLHHALQSRDLDAAQILLFLGANPNYKPEGRMSALEEAKQLKLTTFENLFHQYEYEQVHFVGRDDLKDVWHKRALTRVVHAVAPLTAAQGVSSLVQALQAYGDAHPWLSKFFFYGISGYRVDILMNKPWYKTNFLQHCIQADDLDFVKVLLYLGANPLSENASGQSAMVTALYNFKPSFVKLFWLYVSAPSLKSTVLPILQKYKVLFLLSAISDYNKTKSTVFLSDVALYFNAIGMPIDKLRPAQQIMELIEAINDVSWDMYHVRPFEVVSKNEYRVLKIVMRDHKMIVIPREFETVRI